MAFENRQYVIFDVTEIDKIDFTEVLETSPETLRKSVQGTKTFVKWDGEIPQCVSNLTTSEQYYTHSEILEILSTEEWTSSEII